MSTAPRSKHSVVLPTPCVPMKAILIMKRRILCCNRRGGGALSDVYEPWERLVRIVVLGKVLEVPEKNLLLRQLQYVSEDVGMGRYCWNAECRYCEVSYQRPDDDTEHTGPRLPAARVRRHAAHEARAGGALQHERGALARAARGGRRPREPTRLPARASEPRPHLAVGGHQAVARHLEVARGEVGSSCRCRVRLSFARASSLAHVACRMSSAAPARLERAEVALQLLAHALDLEHQVALRLRRAGRRPLRPPAGGRCDRVAARAGSAAAQPRRPAPGPPSAPGRRARTRADTARFASSNSCLAASSRVR